MSAGATLAAASRTALLDSFYHLDPNGNWTLFLADVSGGGGQPTLTSWGLDIVAAVPEPASIVEGSLAVLFLGGIALLYRTRKIKLPAS